MKNEMSSYFEDPDFKESLAKYEGMVENHTPAYFEADELTDIAEYYASEERHEDADKVIDFALQLHPNDTDALIFRARTLAIKGKLEEAYLVAGLIKDTSDREVMFLKAELLMDENRMEEADALLQQLAEAEENKLDTLIDIILDYIDVNQEGYAQKWFAVIAKNYDLATLPRKHQRLRDMLCDYYIVFNQPALALPFLRMTLDEDPYSIKHWNEQGKCQIQLSEFEAAHESLDFALAIDENNTDTIMLKAFCFHRSGNLTEAANYYLRLAEVSGDITRPYLALSKIYIDTLDYQSAMPYLEDLLKKSSELTQYELAELYCDAAICQAALKDLTKGDEYISTAIELNENDPDIRISAGRYFLMAVKVDKSEGGKMEDINSATDQFEKALQLAPEDERFNTLFNIATTCFDVQNFECAIGYFETINKEFPEEANVTYFFMIYAYFYTRKFQSFMHYYAKIYKELPNMYDKMGTHDYLLKDENFNELLRELKKNVSNGTTDLNKYL